MNVNKISIQCHLLQCYWWQAITVHHDLMVVYKQWVHYHLMVAYVYLHISLPHYHYHADLPEGIELLKCLSDILSWVCLRLSRLSQLSFMQYMGLCVFGFPISFIMIVRIPVLDLIIITKSEVGPICHCLGLGHETMVCAVYLSIFLLDGMKLLLSNKCFCLI